MSLHIERCFSGGSSLFSDSQCSRISHSVPMYEAKCQSIIIIQLTIIKNNDIYFRVEIFQLISLLKQAEELE